MVRKIEPERITVAGMNYAPTNELGVVYLFALLAPRLGFQGIERIQPGFPDCIARRRTGKGDEMVRIEFEYRSSNFRAHRHSVKKCDYIVCWEHDWPGMPACLKVIELRSKVGLGFDVWFQPIAEHNQFLLDQNWKREHWAVASLAKPGDLILMYRTKPAKYVSDIFVMEGRVKKDQSWGTTADIRRMMKLKAPLTWGHMKRDPVLRDSNFIRGQMQGRPRATPYWSFLYELIVNLNPSAEKGLKKFAPQFM